MNYEIAISDIGLLLHKEFYGKKENPIVKRLTDMGCVQCTFK